jgi:hypothetical protein
VALDPVHFLIEAEADPYVCPTDILSSKLLGWRLVRTMTLAEGAERCDFRFKKGGETQVAVPEPLEKYIQSRRASDGRDSIVP